MSSRHSPPQGDCLVVMKCVSVVGLLDRRSEVKLGNWTLPAGV